MITDETLNCKAGSSIVGKLTRNHTSFLAGEMIS